MQGITKEQAAYAAGIIDGEGCVSGDRTQNLPTISVRLKMTKPEVVDWIHALFGGHKYETSSPHGPMYNWVITPGSGLRQFCETISPFMILKKQQADIAIMFAKLTGNGQKLDDKQKVMRYRLADFLNDLNKRRVKEVAAPLSEDQVKGPEEVIQ